MTPIQARDAAREIAAIIPLVMRTVAAELRRTDPGLAPPHFRLLGMLAHCPCNLSELADRQAVSLPTMSNSVTALEERGWVSRTRSSTDRRVVFIELTPAGQEVLAEVEHQTEARLAQLLAPLSQAEYDTLLAGLAILRNVFTRSDRSSGEEP